MRAMGAMPGVRVIGVAVGITVKRGDSLLRVDDHPIVLLYGALPAYRALSEPMKGKDVEQFKANLAALRYTGFTVDAP